MCARVCVETYACVCARVCVESLLARVRVETYACAGARGVYVRERVCVRGKVCVCVCARALVAAGAPHELEAVSERLVPPRERLQRRTAQTGRKLRAAV